MIRKLSKLTIIFYVTSSLATYPMGGGNGGSNAGVYWPNQFAHVETKEWVRDYKYCSQSAYNQTAGQYHSIYNDDDHYRYINDNQNVENTFEQTYLECIHSRGYPEIEY